MDVKMYTFLKTKIVLVFIVSILYLVRNVNSADVEFQCYQCSEYDTDAKGVKTLKSKGATDTCAEFRKIEKANKYKWKRNKTLDGRKPELEAFVNTCKIDTNGSLPMCYNLKGTDRRIIAFDEKGCGLGPENLRIMRPSDSKADGKQNIAEMCEYKPLDFKKQLTELNFLDEVKKNQGLVEMVNCICTESFCNGGNGFWLEMFEILLARVFLSLCISVFPFRMMYLGG